MEMVQYGIVEQNHTDARDGNIYIEDRDCFCYDVGAGRGGGRGGRIWFGEEDRIEVRQ